MKIKLLIADDHYVVREGLRTLLREDKEIESIEEAANGLEAILLVDKNPPDVVIMDYEMPKYDGIYTTKELVKLKPDIKILMLSQYDDKEHVLNAIHAGVKGYLSKDTKVSIIIDAIKAIYNGGTWIKGEIAELITADLIQAAKSKSKRSSNSPLTQREKQIISLFALGNTSIEIAKKLCISNRTVEVHKSNIFKKLNIKSNYQLIRYAVSQKIVNIE